MKGRLGPTKPNPSRLRLLGHETAKRPASARYKGKLPIRF